MRLECFHRELKRKKKFFFFGVKKNNHVVAGFSASILNYTAFTQGHGEPFMETMELKECG